MKKLIWASIPAFFSLSACQKPIKVNPPPPPADYLVCQILPERPDLEPLEAIETDNGAKVYPKPQTDARDAVIARYVISLREAFFSCANQLNRVSDYYAEQE